MHIFPCIGTQCNKQFHKSFSQFRGKKTGLRFKILSEPLSEMYAAGYHLYGNMRASPYSTIFS